LQEKKEKKNNLALLVYAIRKALLTKESESEKILLLIVRARPLNPTHQSRLYPSLAVSTRRRSDSGLYGTVWSVFLADPWLKD